MDGDLDDHLHRVLLRQDTAGDQLGTALLSPRQFGRPAAPAVRVEQQSVGGGQRGQVRRRLGTVAAGHGRTHRQAGREHHHTQQAQGDQPHRRRPAVGCRGGVGPVFRFSHSAQLLSGSRFSAVGGQHVLPGAHRGGGEVDGQQGGEAAGARAGGLDGDPGGGGVQRDRDLRAVRAAAAATAAASPSPRAAARAPARAASTQRIWAPAATTPQTSMTASSTSAGRATAVSAVTIPESGAPARPDRRSDRMQGTVQDVRQRAGDRAAGHHLVEHRREGARRDRADRVLGGAHSGVGRTGRHRPVPVAQPVAEPAGGAPRGPRPDGQGGGGHHGEFPS
ncbi:hypothetical protein KCH_36180 [Kitasatospora cheerisanensis KCTC 2395]|uniref:Uncharacterized protein n=1 Tax=Kitasatospora cheerisanensis KCTC 2395 TaxID=1348663 RepID=A0A066Z2F9_9ACTN|nr:hypothetical protein KCH_36180 [Kitasatospora cheerisanensis KCTC 2395]